MRPDPLQELVDTARRLPGPRCGAVATTPWIPPTPAPHAVDLRALRRRTADALRALAQRATPATAAAVSGGWDQLDHCTVVDTALHEQVAFLREDWHNAAARGDETARAAAVEGLLVLDASLGLCTLLEGRLSTLARLWLDAGNPALSADGHPFLDVGAALRVAAEAWS